MFSLLDLKQLIVPLLFIHIWSRTTQMWKKPVKENTGQELYTVKSCFPVTHCGKMEGQLSRTLSTGVLFFLLSLTERERGSETPPPILTTSLNPWTKVNLLASEGNPFNNSVSLSCFTFYFFVSLKLPEGRPGMSDASPLSGISGLLFHSTLLFHLLFFCLVLLPFVSYLFLPAGPFFWTFSRKFFSVFL